MNDRYLVSNTQVENFLHKHDLIEMNILFFFECNSLKTNYVHHLTQCWSLIPILSSFYFRFLFSLASKKIKIRTMNESSVNNGAGIIIICLLIQVKNVMSLQSFIIIIIGDGCVWESEKERKREAKWKLTRMLSDVYIAWLVQWMISLENCCY